MELKEQFELRTKEKLEREIGQLERQSKQTRAWSNIGNKQKSPFAGHFRTNGTQAYMRQAKAAEQHIRDNLAEKKQLLRNMETERKLKISQESVRRDCLLTADHVTFCYEGAVKPVLRDVTVHIYPGDKIWLRGKNGAGKTTLLKLLAGKLRGTGIRRTGGISIAYVTQEPEQRSGELPVSLKENRKFKELCMRFDLPMDIFNRPLTTLSSGERKKVDIARKLSENHQILFLDEPLNYMDVNFKAQLEEALSDEALTIVFVEHKEEFGERIATQVIEL